MNELDIGWIDSWQLKDKKDVHPSHALQVVTVKSLEKWCNENKLGEDETDLGLEIVIVDDLLSVARKHLKQTGENLKNEAI